MLIETAWSGTGVGLPLGTGVIGWSAGQLVLRVVSDQPITPVPNGRPTPAPDQTIAISQKTGHPKAPRHITASETVAPGSYAMPLMRESLMSITRPTMSRIPMESTPKEASPVSDVTTDTSRVPITDA